jgi:hypothetical protein
MKIIMERSDLEQILKAIESDGTLFSAWTKNMVKARATLREYLAQQTNSQNCDFCGEVCRRAAVCALCAREL